MTPDQLLAKLEAQLPATRKLLAELREERLNREELQKLKKAVESEEPAE